MTWVKICGITEVEDGLEAAALRVDALGFVFAPSGRRLDCAAARGIIARLPQGVMKVGVFVDEEIDQVRRVAAACGLDAVQLHGRESPEYCRRVGVPVIKALRLRGLESLAEMEQYLFADLLLDSWSEGALGGSGEDFSQQLALQAREKRNFILAGGLNPGNVAEAIRLVRPRGVDVSSGVEQSPGRKDWGKMRDFVREVRKADETVE
jgi:phosphoribosylanthranilate isomerase